MLDTRSYDASRFLARLPLFQDIDETALQRIALSATLRRLERGALIFRQGDPCDGFHVVMSGQVKIFVVSPSGQEKVIELIGPGDSFAEALMFLGKPCLVNAQALSNMLLLTVQREAVMNELNHDAQFALRMLAGLSRRLHGLVHDVQAQALQSGTQRVIGYLLNERDAEPATPAANAAETDALTVSLPVSKATLASRLSLTPEYFSKVLRELEEAGLIEVDRRDIRIRDRRRLAAYPG